ncbi:PKD domain-containing protein [Methanocalculus chunghsingensis]|uniref:PKD domain-containing protein n=1 Tax=Methanocalculus chunghsingensis TaxID=156457 RepID=UPI001B8BC776|nr:PKD domain-containing protein [Methanocalculus chunghsingensis]
MKHRIFSLMALLILMVLFVPPAVADEPHQNDDILLLSDNSLTLDGQISGSRVIQVESPHPYPNNYDYTWTITQPGADQMRIHFDTLGLYDSVDRVRLYDGGNQLLTTYYGSRANEDLWSEWYTTDTIKVRLETGGSGTAYGFLIDFIETGNGLISPIFSIGDSVYVQNSDSGLNVRDSPGHGTIILGEVHNGDRGTILEGPIRAPIGGVVHTWWKVAWDGGLNGWSTERYPRGDFYLKVITSSPSNPPVAAFTGTPVTGQVPLAVSFTDQSTGTPTEWQWNFGDGNTSTNQHPMHTYTSAGTYTVSLTVTNADGTATETKTDYIIVDSLVLPGANFSATPTFGRVPLAVSFTDQSTGTPTEWQWNFGDGNTSTNQHPMHTYTSAGTYTVSLTVTNVDGTDTETKKDYITVDPLVLLIANFIANTTNGYAPLAVQFNDTSTGTPGSWLWDFGDGGTSTDQDPLHTYTRIGTNNVTLTISNEHGETTEHKQDYISVHLRADFNRNGRIDIGDVAKVAYMAVGLIADDPEARLMGGAQVTGADAAKIAYFYVGAIPAL